MPWLEQPGGTAAPTIFVLTLSTRAFVVLESRERP
jgi:hypothetical protein